MPKLRRVFKPLVVLLVFSILAQIFSPLVPKTLSAIEAYRTRWVEVMEKGSFKISNDNYQDLSVKKIEIEPRAVTDSPYPLGTGLDPAEQQAAADLTAQ